MTTDEPTSNVTENLNSIFLTHVLMFEQFTYVYSYYTTLFAI